MPREGSALMNALALGGDGRQPRRSPLLVSGSGAIGLGVLTLGVVVAVYNVCKIEVGTGQQAVLIRKVGLDLEPDMELAPPPKDGKTYYKGVQTGGANNGVL